MQMVGSTKAAWYATVLYAWNPAAIFMSAAYSESTYALFSFLGILAIHRQVG